MTFLAIIADSLSDTLPVIQNQGCIKHTGKRPVCVDNDAISYSADISIIMAYHKLCDDISDEKSIKAFFARIPYVRAYRSASKRHPEIAKSADESILKLNRLEEEKCCHIDMVADTFATLTSEIFKSYDSSLASVGYNLGRFIYIADAFKDICDDIKHGSYNPYVCAYDENDVMIGVSAEDFNTAGATNVELPVSITGKAKYFKAFVWDENQTPIARVGKLDNK